MMFRNARMDVHYSELEEQYEKLGERFERMVQTLPQGEQDLVWEYICASEALNWRMLELILEKRI